MGCLDSIMKLFRAGDHIVCGENVYGGTFRLFDKILQHYGTVVQLRRHARSAAGRRRDDAGDARRARRDADESADAPHRHRRRRRDRAPRATRLLIVDNTFASPYFQRPLELGADIVFHSTTKYLNGHSDMIGGCAIVRDDDLAARLQFIHNAAGAVAGPFDAWLALRGTKTLHLRMRQHDANGREIANWLAERVGARERVLHRAAVASAARAGASAR